MSTRDEDILDFDFFDEEEPPSWDEPTEGGSGGPPRGRGPRPPQRRLRAPRNLTPLLRLVALIGLAILIVVLLAVGTIGNNSARLGEQLATTLTTVGLKQEELDAKLAGYVQVAETQMQNAEDLDTPGPLKDPNEGALNTREQPLNAHKAMRAPSNASGSSNSTAVT